jgi:hypothetical protein
MGARWGPFLSYVHMRFAKCAAREREREKDSFRASECPQLRPIMQRRGFARVEFMAEFMRQRIFPNLRGLAELLCATCVTVLNVFFFAQRDSRRVALS